METFNVTFAGKNAPGDRDMVVDHSARTAMIQVTLSCPECRICSKRIYQTNHLGELFTPEGSDEQFRTMQYGSVEELVEQLSFWQPVQVWDVTDSDNKQLVWSKYSPEPTVIAVEPVSGTCWEQVTVEGPTEVEDCLALAGQLKIGDVVQVTEKYDSDHELIGRMASLPNH